MKPSSCGVCRTSLRNINTLTSVTLILDDQSLKSLSFLFITCLQMLHLDKAVPFLFWFPFTTVACYVFSICLRKFDLRQGRPSPLNSESYYIVFKINLFLCSFSLRINFSISIQLESCFLSFYFVVLRNLLQ